MIHVVEMPSLSPTMEKGKVVKWCKQEGDTVQKGEILFEVETDKANVEVECYKPGVLRKILVQEGVEVPTNTPIALIADSKEEDISTVLDKVRVEIPAASEEDRAVTSESVPEPPSQKVSPKRKQMTKISPLAKRIAHEEGIEIETLTGTGPGGRIVKEDVKRAIQERAKKTPPSASKPGMIRIPEGEYEEIPLTKMRKVIAQRLQESKQTAPHFYLDMASDATALEQLRQDLGKKSDQLGTKVTINDILIKLVSQALREFPMVNASFLGDRIRVHRDIHIGMAVGIDEGLVVPVIKHTDQKTISQISREAKTLVDKARHKRLLPEEYAGGTFTVTNLGMFGVETFHAIINPPESAILSVSAIIPKAVAMDGEVVVKPSLKLSLSVDHRVVDGVSAARFLARVKELVEAPFLLFA